MTTDREMLIGHLNDEVTQIQLKCDWSAIELLEEAKKSAIRDTNGRLSICSLTVGAFKTGVLRDTYGAEIDYLEVPDILDIYGVLWKNRDGRFNPKITKTAKGMLRHAQVKAEKRQAKLVTADHIFEAIAYTDIHGKEMSRILLLRSLGGLRRWNVLDTAVENYLKQNKAMAYPMEKRS